MRQQYLYVLIKLKCRLCYKINHPLNKPILFPHPLSDMVTGGLCLTDLFNINFES